MNERNLCKSCMESVRVTEEVIEELVKEAEEESTKMVSQEVYETRLKICEGCASLQYGTTCAHSGGIVHYGAKFKEKSCPFPGKSKWQKVV